jgi:hypothetical protein
MTQTATDYLDAIDHLPVGGKLYLEDVSWDEYEPGKTVEVKKGSEQ